MLNSRRGGLLKLGCSTGPGRATLWNVSSLASTGGMCRNKMYSMHKHSAASCANTRPLSHINNLWGEGILRGLAVCRSSRAGGSAPEASEGAKRVVDSRLAARCRCRGAEHAGCCRSHHRGLCSHLRSEWHQRRGSKGAPHGSPLCTCHGGRRYRRLWLWLEEVLRGATASPRSTNWSPVGATGLASWLG